MATQTSARHSFPTLALKWAARKPSTVSVPKRVIRDVPERSAANKAPGLVSALRAINRSSSAALVCGGSGGDVLRSHFPAPVVAGQTVLPGEVTDVDPAKAVGV